MDGNLSLPDRLLREGNIAEAIRCLDGIIAQNPSDDRAFFMRGKAYWKSGQRARATSDYLKAVELNPDSPAASALENARDIEDFFNPDIFNP